MAIIEAKNNAVLKKDKDDYSKWLSEILGDISKGSATKEIAVGAASGWLTGYLSMKVGRAVAFAVGGSIIVLNIAHHKGYVKINWDKLSKTADKVVDRIERETAGNSGSNLDRKIDKMEKFVDQKLAQAERFVDRQVGRVDNKSRRWFSAMFNNGRKRGYELQELHLFLVSFAASFAIGLASG